MDQTIQHARTIFNAATPVLHIHGVTEKYWKRNTSNSARGDRDCRIGPWMQGEYSILDERLWSEKGPCLYMVQAGDKIRYVGISKNRLKDRWRLSPAYDAQTMQPLPKRQIFHSQCWRNIELAIKADPGMTFEVRAIKSPALTDALNRIGEPLSVFSVFGADEESMVASVERWLCNRSNDELATWNIAMTRRTPSPYTVAS